MQKKTKSDPPTRTVASVVEAALLKAAEEKSQWRVKIKTFHRERHMKERAALAALKKLGIKV